MSPLAFDKQGKPFTFDTRTEQLLVRVFRNPGMRGTCCQVFDPDGQPLYVDPEIDHPAFRKEVGNAPGLYRLDQCDENGNQIEGAPAAYVSIAAPRNASATDPASSEVSPLVIIQQMAAIQADVMKTMAQQQAALMAATAEIMRAPYRPAPAAPVPELRNADSSDDNDEYDSDEYDDDEDAEDGTEETASKPLDFMMKVMAPHAPDFGKWLWKKFAEFMKDMKGAPSTTQPAAVPVPTPVCASTPAQAPQPVPAPVSTAAGSSPTPAPVAPTASVVESSNEVYACDENTSDTGSTTATTFAPTKGATGSTATPSATTATVPLANTSAAPTSAAIAPASTTVATPANAAISARTATAEATAASLPMPTEEQLAHLYAIRERLAPKELAIAERAMARMDPRMLVHWLAELSAMSVDEATAKIRGVIAQI